MLVRSSLGRRTRSCPIGDLRRRGGRGAARRRRAADADRRAAGRAGRRQRFVAAWAKGDYAAMHAELGDGRPARGAAGEVHARPTAPRPTIATATAIRPGKVGKPKDGVVEVPMTVAHARLRDGPRDAAPGVLRRRRRQARSRGRRGSSSRAWPTASASRRRTQLPRRGDDPRAQRQPARRRPGPHVADPRRRRLDRRQARPAPAGARGAAARARLPRRRASSASAAWSASSRSASPASPAASCGRAAACSRRRSRGPPRPCTPRSTPTCSAPRSPPRARGWAASPPCGRGPARSSRWPASPSRACSRPARRSRSSR